MALTDTNPGMADVGVPDTLIPLDDRPWELMDHMIPFPPKVPHNEQFLASRPLSDTSSVPMALFGPKLKRDILPEQSRSADLDEGEIAPGTAWMDYASERNLGDGLAGEPLAAKQIATMLYAGLHDAATGEDEVTVNTCETPLLGLDAAMTPATSISAGSQNTRPLRMSTRLAQASGSNRDPIRIDEDEENNEDSDEIEAVDDPPAKRPRTASRSRPTIGGKAPPRKTIGGKSAANQTTGGKGVRKTTGGKAPRTGRRKSIAE